MLLKSKQTLAIGNLATHILQISCTVKNVFNIMTANASTPL